MPRLARLDAPGVFYHVMIRGIERRIIFWNKKDREDFLDRLVLGDVPNLLTLKVRDWGRETVSSNLKRGYHINCPFGYVGKGRVRVVTRGLNLFRHGTETAPSISGSYPVRGACQGKRTMKNKGVRATLLTRKQLSGEKMGILNINYSI